MLPSQPNDQILTKDAYHRHKRIRQFSKHHNWKTKKRQELAETETEKRKIEKGIIA